MPSIDMKAVFEALLPPGSAWQPKVDGDYDQLIAGMGANAEFMRVFLRALATIRDPALTEMLKDLEKEYGLITNLGLTESDRRDQLAAVKYATRYTGAFDELQQILVKAGFDVVVTPNDPAIDPDNFLTDDYAVLCLSDIAYCEYRAVSGIDSIICHQGAPAVELIVNGDLFDQKVGYSMECLSDIAYAGYQDAYSGFFDEESMIKTLIEYSISVEKASWPRVFFISKSVSGFEKLIDWNMEYSGVSHWEPSINTTLSKKNFALNDAFMELPGVREWTVFNNAILTKAESDLDYSTQALRIAYNGTPTPGARQYPLLPGCAYNIKGYARGDGSINPQIASPSSTIWVGTASTDWQYFDVDFTPTSLNNSLTFFCGAISTHWVEFDKLILTNKDARGNRVIELIKASGPSSAPEAVQLFDQIDHPVTVRGLAWSGNGVTVPELFYIKPDLSRVSLWTGTNSQQKQTFSVAISVPFIGLVLSGNASVNAEFALYDHIEIHNPLFERAQISNARRDMLRHLVLRSKPLHSWGLLLADYI